MFKARVCECEYTFVCLLCIYTENVRASMCVDFDF